jgi:hypothetical protein
MVIGIFTKSPWVAHPPSSMTLAILAKMAILLNIFFMVKDLHLGTEEPSRNESVSV